MNHGHNSPPVKPVSRPILSSADRFQLVVEAIQDYAIYMLDTDGVIASWSRGAERLKGFSAEEVIGRHYGMFFRPEDAEIGMPMQQLMRATLHGRTEDEGWRVRKDGSTFWANIVISTIRDEDGSLVGFAKITRDITERKRLGELEHSLQRMNEFLAMLGHELRGPLSSIRNCATFLAAQTTDPVRQAKAVRMLDRQVDLLTRLLDGLLDAGRLTSGKLRISPTRALFASMLSDAIESVSPVVSERKQRLSVSMPPGQIWASVDSTRITQVLQNLLSNASKFTPVGGSIDIIVDVRSDRLFVTVKDNGVGMDPRAIDGLFRLFSQGQSEQNAEKSGLGIGLALSRAIVEMHGGRITGTSDGPGKGSSFTFELPNVFITPA